MTEETINDLKTVQLELFQQFIDICKKEKLKYYLIGGTCIGAIRHKGFIPWDDDIDVALPRPDYNRFLLTAGKYLENNTFLQTFETDSEYIHNFAKLRNSSTTFIETTSSKLNINHGIYIDIFPIDGGGRTFDEAKENFQKIEKYSRRIRTHFYLPSDHLGEKFKNFIKKILFCFGPTVSESVRIRDRLYQYYKYEESDWVVNYGGAWGIKEIVPKELFGDGTIGEFEGMHVSLPQNYDEYLSRIYGDYMMLPPKEKQMPHHYCEVIDPHKPYTEYLSKKTKK